MECTDLCSNPSLGVPSGGWTCTSSGKCVYLCGDGKVSITESCDCGENGGRGNGCSDDCLETRPGWKCSAGDLTTASECFPICGDGLNVGKEVCDDGNTVSGDGCLADCSALEPEWICETKRDKPASSISNTLATWPHDTMCQQVPKGVQQLGSASSSGSSTMTALMIVKAVTSFRFGPDVLLMMNSI